MRHKTVVAKEPLLAPKETSVRMRASSTDETEGKCNCFEYIHTYIHTQFPQFITHNWQLAQEVQIRTLAET